MTVFGLIYNLLASPYNESDKHPGKSADNATSILEIREYDIPFYVRVAIDGGKFSLLPLLPLNLKKFESVFGTMSKPRAAK